MLRYRDLISLSFIDGEDPWERLKQYSVSNWDWNKLSSKAPLEFIEENLHLPWNWYGKNPRRFYERNTTGISNNPNLTMDFVLKHLDKNWDWECLTEHENISIKDIEDNIELDWNWDSDIWFEGISGRPDLTIDFILKFVDKQFRHWDKLSANKAISLEDILKHDHLPWCWVSVHIYHGKKIPMNIIIKHLHNIELCDFMLEKNDFKEKYGDFKKCDDRFDFRYSYYRTLVRCRVIKEELMAKCWSPERMQYYLEKYNYDINE